MLSETGELMDVIDTPVAGNDISPVLVAQYVESLVSYGPITMAVVEFVSARPGQSAPAMWRFGVGYGKVLGVLGALRVPVYDVTPSKWKKDMGLTSDKEKSRQRALQEWPGKSDLFKRKKDEGRAEAALIGLWWVRKGRAPYNVSFDGVTATAERVLGVNRHGRVLRRVR